MRSRRLFTSVLPLLALMSCNPFHQAPAVQVSTQDATLNSRWHANLASPANLAGVVQMNGSASMAPNADGVGTDISIDLANAAPGGVHPWAMHTGQCGNGMDEGVVGPAAAYTPLTVDGDGHATGVATVPLHTPSTGNYFIAVEASAANTQMVVACGNLAPPTG